VRLLKIDVERAEDEVLRGAQALLSAERIDYLLVEMYSESDAQALLEARGYAGYQIDAERHRLVPAASVSGNRFGDYLYVGARVAAAFDRDFRDAMDDAASR
jgi:hypothetical protein